MTEKITIIAEAGVNHNGKINLAYKLIDIALDNNYIKDNLVYISSNNINHTIGRIA